MNPAKCMPPAWSGILERDRLVSKLASWERRKLVLIHGPAGQGKSTLAADYIRTLRSPTVWYTLDPTDEDPEVFLASFGQAIQRTVPRLLPVVPAIPRQRYDTGSPSPVVVNWTSKVLGSVAEGLIVFDDYQPRTERCPLTRLLETLIAASPPAIRFMVISRSQPALDIARLRVKRAVGELSGDDLRFTDAEIADLYGSVLGMPLSPDDAARVNRMTEGWAAGLVLMHEYLSSAHVPLAAMTIGGGTGKGFQDHVFEYLAQEVFTHLPEDLQDFLLRTSVTDHLPAPLAGLLTGLPAGDGRGERTVGGMVKELRKRNLFVSTVDAEGTVLRYHALFREFLAKRLMVSKSHAEVKRLHDIAADYFLTKGETVRAIDLYLGTGEYGKALPLIERAGRDLIAHGLTASLLRMLDALPPSLQERPWPLLYRSVSCRFTDPRSALALADRALSAFRAGKNAEGQMLSLCAVIEACFHSGGDFQRMQRAAIQAQRILRGSRRVLRETRSLLLFALGTAAFFTGRLDNGIEVLRQAMDRFRASDDHFHAVSCALYLTPCALYHGDLALARDTVRQGFEAQRSLPDEPGGLAALHLVQAMADLFTGEFLDADTSLDTCRRLVRENGLEAIDLLLLNIGGWVKLARGDPRSAEMLLTECLRKGELAGKPFFSVSASHLLSILYYFQRRFDAAKRMSDRSLSAHASGQSRLFRGIYLIMSGAIHAELARTARAERELKEALTLLRACGAAQQEANAHLMLARLYGKMKKRQAAVRHLREGFSIGRTRRFTYYAPLTAEQLQGLAQDALASGVCMDYCRTLLGQAAAVAPVLRITCLGGFQVESNGIPMRDTQWKSRRAKTLVKLLAAQSGSKLSRDAIVDILWPDAPMERHATLMSSLLHRTRKNLDLPGKQGRHMSCIVQEGDHLLLNKELVWTDVAAFRAAVEHARRTAASGKTKDAFTACERATRFYGGDFLPNETCEDWTIPVREQLRRLFTETLDRAAELSESLGEKERSRALYEQMFSHDACHDHACRWLMEQYAAEGKRYAAITVYERHELAVRKELDIEPDEQTKKIYRSIIGG